MPKKFLIIGIVYRNKRALLIAQDYEDDDTEDSLPHAIAQMFRLRKILITKYGFKKKDVLVMTDRKGEEHNTCYPPTSSNIKKVFKKLAYGLKPDDLFLLYFIGHGGRYKAPQDSPNDTGFVEFISTAESTRICDFELREMEKTIPKGVNFTFVCESCSSSGMIEGSHECIGRSVLNDYKKKDGKNKKVKCTKDNREKEMPSSILISSCQSDEECYYGLIKNGQYVSYFTHTLLELLYQSEGELSLRELVTEINKILSRTTDKYGAPIKQRAGLYCSPPQSEQFFLGGMVHKGGKKETYGDHGEASTSSTQTLSSMLPNADTQDAKSGGEKFQVRILGDSSAQTTDDVLCQAGKGGDLMHDETTIIAGAPKSTEKTAKDAMTPISKT